METKTAAFEGRRKGWLTQSLVLVILIVVLGIVTSIVNPRFLRINNILNIFQQIAILGIVASGIGMLLVAGQIDISVGSQISWMGVILAMIIQKMLGLPQGGVAAWRAQLAIPLTIVVTFAVGALLGLINGITVVRSKAASFIITLGFMTAYKGAALLTCKGASFMLFGKFEWLGRGRILDTLPVSILFFAGVLIIAFIVLKYFRYGRFLYAIGGNKQAAYVSGIKTSRVTITAYVVVGLCNALAALILISRNGSALATTGDAYALDALASVIVGGVALTGGRGSALNIFLGVLLIGIVSNALVIMNINPYARDVVIGLIIISAVTVGSLTSARE